MSDVRKIIDLDRLSRFKDDMDQEIAGQTPAISGNKLTIGSSATPIAQDIVNVNDINGVPTTAYGSAAAARAAVDASSGLRIQGQIITYLLADGWYTDQYIGSATDSTSWGTASNWQTLGPVSVSQNTQTGKTELKIGDIPALIVDNEPTAGSDNLVKSGGIKTELDSLDNKIDLSLQTNNTQYSNGTTRLSIVSEEADKGLNADGTLFYNYDFITCSYSVVGGKTYFITGRQPGSGSAVACAYDSNNVFIYAYTYTPSTDIVNQPITIPVNATVLKVCISGLNDVPSKRPSVYESVLRVEKAELRVEKAEQDIFGLYNRQFRDIFLTGAGQFFIEETRVFNGKVYFSYTATMQYFTQNNETIGVGTFAEAVEAAGLTTTTSPKGRTCIEVAGGKYLVVDGTNAHLAIKNPADVVYTDIVLFVNVAGRVGNAIDEIITDMAKNSLEEEAAIRAEADLKVNVSLKSLLNNEVYSYTKGTQLTISSEEDDRGLNADGTLFFNDDFITCSYAVTPDNTYLITGRQPGSGSAVACAYDSNGVFVYAYTFTPSTDIVDQPIIIPLGASILKVCISGLNANPNKRPSVYNAVKASKIDAANTKADTALAAVDSVPSYWETLLTTKEASIVSRASSIGRNGDSFIFITDIHWSSFNYRVSPVLIKHVLDNTSISNIFIGGDISQGGTITELMGFVSKVKKYTDRMFATPGNHDPSDTAKFYSVFGKMAENYTDTKKVTDYYLDNESQKIRYIFLTTQNGDNAITQGQITFLNNCVSQLTSEWTVFVITHIIWHAAIVSENPSLTTCGQSVMDAVDAASALTDATIGAIICGHLHRDWDGQTTGGIKVIGTTCDANGGQAVYDPVTPTRTPGTTTEQIFDVYNIDTNAKKIYITRIGGNGTDREFSY